LKADLEENLFGQHVASKVILKAVTDFMKNKNPKKPLVLSLHGWTGTGKNFISHLIVKNIYRNGMKSSFVPQFVATARFPHPGEVQTYKTAIANEFNYFPKEKEIFSVMGCKAIGAKLMYYT
ncbi:TOR1B protein, partial [Amia calva]|nr:TOR1B protein [Amia calva]